MTCELSHSGGTDFSFGTAPKVCVTNGRSFSAPEDPSQVGGRERSRENGLGLAKKRERWKVTVITTQFLIDLMLANGWAPWHYFIQASQQTLSRSYLSPFYMRKLRHRLVYEAAPSPMASVGRAGIGRFNPKVYALFDRH